MSVSVIIAAGGNSTRMAGKNKLLEEICGKALLIRTTEVFLKTEQINNIIIVAAAEWINSYSKLFAKAGILEKIRMVEGGSSRRESVYFGLLAVDKNTEVVVIHDAARPLVTESLIIDCIDAAIEHGAASAAVPLTDTLKEADKKGYVKKTLRRDNLFRIQTPQAFIYKDILKLHKKAALRGLKVTDDAQIAEYFDYSVFLVESDYSNIKITTDTDLILAEVLFSNRNDAGAHDPLASAEHS